MCKHHIKSELIIFRKLHKQYEHILPKIHSYKQRDGFAIRVDGPERALVGANDLGDSAHNGIQVIRSVATVAGDQAAGVEVEWGGEEHQMYLQLEDRMVVRPASFMGSLETIWCWMPSGTAHE